MTEEKTNRENNDTPERSSAAFHASGLSPAKLNFRKLENIQKLFQYATILVLLVFIGLIAYSYFKLQDINKKIESGNQQLLTQNDQIAKNQAKIDSQNNVIKSQQQTNTILQNVTQSISEKSPEQGEEIKKAIEKSVAQTPKGSQVPARIYIQIAHEDQRARATKVAKLLQAKGFIVPGIENVEKKSKLTDRSEIRYCNIGNSTDKDVNDIVEIVQNLSISLTKQELHQNCDKVRPRHYEIWFGHSFSMPENASHN